jgi:hypothetical protein
MGRKKPGKQRRSRIPRQYTLQQLQPPGTAYDEWFRVPSGGGMVPDDPRLDPDSIKVMRQLTSLAPAYNGLVPLAAIHLDNLIDTGHLPVLNHGDASGSLVPISELAAKHGLTDLAKVRDSIHNLHAHGALLIHFPDGQDLPMVRLVAKRPEKPGDSWGFVGDPDVVVAGVCIPQGMVEEGVSAQIVGTVMYMRGCMSQLESPDPVEFATHEGVNGVEHAKALFAEAKATGWVDYKGCDACPTAHLCTREED